MELIECVLDLLIAQVEINTKNNELSRLRSKNAKLKRKLGIGRTKTAALRHLQNLRQQKLQALGEHDSDEAEENGNNHSFAAGSPISSLEETDLDITREDLRPEVSEVSEVTENLVLSPTITAATVTTATIAPNSPTSPTNTSTISPTATARTPPPNNNTAQFPISPSSHQQLHSTSRDDADLSPLRIEGSRKHSRLSTPRRLYDQKRSRRRSMSDDDILGMLENSGDDSDDSIFTTERDEALERQQKRDRKVRKQKQALQNLSLSQTDEMNHSLDSSTDMRASAPLLSEPLNSSPIVSSLASKSVGRRRRLATQPMTPDEKAVAQKMSLQRAQDSGKTSNRNENNNQDRDDEDEDDDTQQEKQQKHSRVQSAMQLSSPNQRQQKKDQHRTSSLASDSSFNRSVISDLSSSERNSGSSEKSNSDSNMQQMQQQKVQQQQLRQQSNSMSPASFSCVWGSGRLPGLPDGECSPASMVALDYAIFRGKRIVQVACGLGSRQAMYLTDGGDVYRSHNTFDANDAGIHDASTERSSYATLSSSPTSKLIPTENSVHIKVREPTLVQDFAWERALGHNTIVSVSCGAEHCCALADGGQVYTWGRASFGRLGLAKHYKDSNKYIEIKTPQLVLPLLGTRIVDIQCGSSHTIVREASSVENVGDGRVRCIGGRLFSWGKGDSGQLGHGNVKTQPLPKEIKKGALQNHRGVVSVGCGWNFTVAVHFDGRVSCWGKGSEGQLGTSTSFKAALSSLSSTSSTSSSTTESLSSSASPCDLHRPTEIQDSSFGKMDEDGMVPWCPHTVCCGKAHTIILCQRHPGSVMMAHGLTAADMSRPTAVFSWGYGEKGELGTQHALRPVPAQIQFPNLMPGDAIISITTGSLHCAAVTQFGNVYVWGCNRHGALGVKNMNDIWVPVPVPMHSLMHKVEEGSTLKSDGSVVYPIQVACGERCTIILLDKTPSGRGQLNGTTTQSLPLPSSRPVEMQSSISRHFLNGTTRRSSFIVGSGTRGSSLNVHQFGGFGGDENGDGEDAKAGSGHFRNASVRSSNGGHVHSGSDLSVMSTRAQASLSDHTEDSNSTSRKNTARSSTTMITDAKTERERQKNLRRDSKIWQEDILPRWERTHEAPSRKVLRQQCARLSTGGVPPHLRRRVWPLLVANALRITPELFEMCRKRACSNIEKNAKAAAIAAAASSNASSNESSKTSSSVSRTRAHTLIGREATLSLIDVDLPRTFPQLKLFDSTGPFHAKLKEVLETYACYRPDLGYVQGMSYIAALLCLYMTDTYQAFCCLANVMIDKNSHFFAFFNLPRTISNEKNRPSAYYDIFNDALQEQSKSLHRKMMELKDNGLEPSVYLFNWLQTAYLRILPLNVTSRVWDLFLIDGTPFLFRVGIALLVLFKPYLLEAEFEDSAKLLTNHPSKENVWEDMVTEVSLFKQIDSISLSRGVKERLTRLISGSTR